MCPSRNLMGCFVCIPLFLRTVFNRNAFMHRKGDTVPIVHFLMNAVTLRLRVGNKVAKLESVMFALSHTV